MLMLPARALAMLFGAMLSVTSRLPLPEAPPETVIQPGPGATVHAQLPPVNTWKLRLPPVEAIEAPGSESEMLQLALVCSTAKLKPPTLIVPFRTTLLGLFATLKAIVALPVPLLGFVRFSQDAEELADQGQLPSEAVKLNSPDPPTAGAEVCVEDKLKEQPVPNCVNV